MTHATMNVVPQMLKILMANHRGRKMSVTDPRSAPRFSAILASGHFQPLETSTTPSMSPPATATHVNAVIRLKMPE
jgi:hypothetical protein